MIDIILASSSPRRQKLLREAGIEFKVKPAEIDETTIPGEKPDELVRRLAREKADVIAQKYPDEVVLGADTIVNIEDQILGKPTDLAQARQMLNRLNGQRHFVFTGVAIIHLRTGQELIWHAKTSVLFRLLSKRDIDRCLERGNPLDKAGAYAIQEHESFIIESYKGLRSNVIGLPIEEVVEKLLNF